jgi:DNA-directed RNA polymerase III subunit RPC4
MAEVTSAEVYSDNEDGPSRGTGVIDIEAVSGLGESAPTSVYRERDLDGGKAKAKAADKAKLKEAKRRKMAARAAREAHLASGVAAPRIKDEPVSPSASIPQLPEVRHGDSMIATDMDQDRDDVGRRLGAPAMSREISGVSTLSDTPDVDAANALDLSESEDEEYEEDMEGDFVFVPGMDNPEDKLFTFQFPSTFPRFTSREAPDEEKKEDVKPTPARSRVRKALPPPEGRVGTLCVMKSGKVKLVLGEGEQGIVMDVNAGVPSTFLTQLVHVDAKKHSTTVLGEVHKSYTVMPDVERLLDQLFLNGGETPGDRERAARREAHRQALDRGLVKMEPSSP